MDIDEIMESAETELTEEVEKADGRKKKSASKKTLLQKEKEEKQERKAELAEKLADVRTKELGFMEERGSVNAEAIVGFKMSHRKFGRGQVVSVNGPYFVMDFDGKELKMKLPDAVDKGIIDTSGLKKTELKKLDKICDSLRKIQEAAEESRREAAEIGLKLASIN